MDKSYPIKTPIVIRSLDVEKGPFRPRREGEEILGPQVPYLSVIGALMYLANNTRSDIEFAANLLARHSASPTKRHWVGVKSILRYLNGTRDLGLFYSRNQDPVLLGYAYASYLSDPTMADHRLALYSCKVYNNILEVFKADLSVYFHQSF
jgi:hypothetical protein